MTPAFDSAAQPANAYDINRLPHTKANGIINPSDQKRCIGAVRVEMNPYDETRTAVIEMTFNPREGGETRRETLIIGFDDLEPLAGALSHIVKVQKARDILR